MVTLSPLFTLESEPDELLEALTGLELAEGDLVVAFDLLEKWKTKGKKLTAEHRKKISDALKGRGTHKTKAFKGGATGAGTGKGALAKRHPVGTRVHTKDGTLQVTGHTSGYIGVEGGKKKWYKLNELQDQAPKVAAKATGKVDGSGLKTKAKSMPEAVPVNQEVMKRFGAPAKVSYGKGSAKSLAKQWGMSPEEAEAFAHQLTGGQAGTNLFIEHNSKTTHIRGGYFSKEDSTPYMMVHRVVSHDKGKITAIRNESLELKYTPKGLGTAMLAHQARAAQAKGIKEFTTLAAKTQTMNGYYTWARLGYNAKFKEPEGPTKAVDLHQLMSTPEGREHWKKNGDSVSATFDLKPGSKSMKILEGYAKAKGVWGE